MSLTKFHQKFSFLFEISQKSSKSFRDFHRRDILEIIHDLFETINFIHIIIETQKRFAITLNQIIENHFDLKNQVNAMTTKMKNLNVIKKKLTIIKNFMSILINFFNNIFTRLNNKRNNSNEFIYKLKNTRAQEILLSNAFKLHQNSIVFFIFLNFFIAQNTRNNFQTFYKIFYRLSQMQKIQKTKSLFEEFAHQNDFCFSFIFSNNDLNSYRD